MAAADVLFVDLMIRSGRGVEFFTTRPPFVPGNGVAGRVISAAEGVDRVWIGRQVVAHTGVVGGSGGYAEQALVSAEDLIPIPDGLGVREAAALLHDGATAFGLLEAVGVKPNDWVLVTAAAGGLGLLLVQLARAAGGRVVAVARGRQNLEVIRDVGADTVIDYSEAGWIDRVRAGTEDRGPDVVFDGGGGQLGAAAFNITAAEGRFSAHGMSAGEFARSTPWKRPAAESPCTASRTRHSRQKTSGDYPPRPSRKQRQGGSGHTLGRPSRDRGPPRHRQDRAAALISRELALIDDEEMVEGD